MDRSASLDRAEAVLPHPDSLSFDGMLGEGGSRLDSRLEIDNRLVGIEHSYDDVIAGLTSTPKWVSSTYFYDERGSQLFEQICQLPEYYPTRTEAAILRQAAAAIAARVGRTELFELGSGSSTKTRLLLDALSQREGLARYIPVDVSSEMLVQSAKTLLAAYPRLHVRAVADDYFQVWDRLPEATAKRTIVFLGSTLGNLDPESCDRFLTRLSTSVNAGDYFLLGIDLQKPIDILEAAYNDSQGVTAAFNLNVLQHLNQRLKGNFYRDRFVHRAFYRQDKHQIEMHLVSQAQHTVALQALDLSVEFAAGESMRTEISRKFNLAEMESVLSQKGWTVRDRWTDEREWFGLMLLQKA